MPAASRSSSTATPVPALAGGSDGAAQHPARPRPPQGRLGPAALSRRPRRACRRAVRPRWSSASKSRMMRSPSDEGRHGRTERDHAPPEPRRADRPGHARRRRPDRRAVHDQHRHRRRRRDGPPGDGARRRRLGDRPDHGQHRRRREGRAAHPRPPPGARLRGAAGRRLPLPRPSVPDPLSRVRRGARQAAHQSRQRRVRQEARHASSR